MSGVILHTVRHFGSTTFAPRSHCRMWGETFRAFCRKSLVTIAHLYHKCGAEMFDQETHCWLTNGRSPDELANGFTRSIRIVHQDNMEVMIETLLNPPEVTSSSLPDPAPITRGNIADFAPRHGISWATLWQTGGRLRTISGRFGWMTNSRRISN